jgi:hypothetical protein
VENISLATGGVSVGGLVGYKDGGALIGCFATGSVRGQEYVGGLVGVNAAGSIADCFAAGSVSGASIVGGLIGSNWDSLADCFSAGSVSGTDILGGLAGENWTTRPGSLNGCYWDITTSGSIPGIDAGDTSGATGANTSEMMTLSTFTSAGWDFASTWAICEGINYPRLKWRIPAADWICPDGVALEDLLYLSQRWLAETPETVGSADTNGDGRVDLNDFIILSSIWNRE